MADITPAATSAGAGSSNAVPMMSAIEQISGPGVEEQPIDYGDEPEESVAAPEAAEETDPAAEPGAEGETGEGEQPLDAEILKAAEEYGVDPETLKGLTIGQIVAKLAEGAKAPQATPQEIDWMEGIEAAKEAAKAEPEPEKAPAKEPPLDDIGVAWRSQEEAVKDLNDAFAEGDFRKVADVQNAMFRRQFAGMAAPLVQAEIQKAIQTIREEMQQQFGDVVPNVRQQMHRQQLSADKDWAVAKLRTDTKNAPLLEAMLKDEGKELSQILADNPEIRDIRIHDDNPRVSARKTLHRRFEVALKFFRAKQNGSLKPEKAKELVANGIDIERRNQQDRVRQGLNAGKGASTTGVKPPRNYVHELNSGPGKSSIDELMGH